MQRTVSQSVHCGPELSTGLDFDLVVLIGPEAFDDGIQGAVDRYVTMTRAIQ